MMTSPMLAGIATQSAVKMSGGVLRSVFCQRQEGTEAAPPDQREELARGLSDGDQKEREQGCGAYQGECGNDDGLCPVAPPEAKVARKSVEVDVSHEGPRLHSPQICKTASWRALAASAARSLAALAASMPSGDRADHAFDEIVRPPQARIIEPHVTCRSPACRYCP